MAKRGQVAFVVLGDIEYDNRVIKMVRSISEYFDVDLFTVGAKSEVLMSHRNSVRVVYVDREVSWRSYFLRHSFFCYEFSYVSAAILRESKQYDYIWVNDLPALYLGWLTAERIGSKLVYDSHEIYVETLNQFYLKSSSLIKTMLFRLSLGIMRFHGRGVESKLIKRAYRIITVNRSLAEYFKTTYGLKSEVDVIMNWPTLAEARTEESINLRSLVGFSENDVVLLYQGVLNSGRGLNILIETLSHVDPKVKLVIIGEGLLKDVLQEQVVALNLSQRVVFLPFVSIESLWRYTVSADIGISLVEDFNLSKKYASPNKLYEYIHASIPVICTRSVETERIFSQFDLGYQVDNSIEDLVSNINRLMNDLEKGKVFKDLDKARALYNWQVQSVKVRDILMKK